VFQRYAYILPIAEKWWNKFCDRNRAEKTLHAYVRRGKVGPKNVELLLFYVTRPSKEIRGFGKFVDRITENADNLWKTHGQETCLNSYKEYANLLQGRLNATFILFKNLRELPSTVPITTVTKIMGIQRMPQMGKYINREEAYKLLRTWPSS